LYGHLNFVKISSAGIWYSSMIPIFVFCEN
jgi:hypothetical protein